MIAILNLWIQGLANISDIGGTFSCRYLEKEVWRLQSLYFQTMLVVPKVSGLHGGCSESICLYYFDNLCTD